MKILKPVNRILMTLLKDRKHRKTWVAQKRSVERLLSHFNMPNSKPVNTSFSVACKLSFKQCPGNEAELEEMSQVPYSHIRLL